MTLNAVSEYIESTHERYKNATKKQKSRILDEFCAVTRRSRKRAIKLMNEGPKSPKKKRGPARKYDDDFVRQLEILWKKMHRMCGRRMVAALPIWLPHYSHEGFTDEIRQLMLEISASSIDRLLRPYKKAHRKGLSSTKAGNMLKSQIPIQILDSKVTEPGYVEADTVVHCGDTLLGEYANSLTVTDLFSGWTENRATWGKKSEVILDRIIEIRKSLPFSMKGFSCDNGSEFINFRLRAYFDGRHPGTVKFTRRRPYKKNDAAHVEQKNDVMVRKVFGYDRLDCASFVPLMNEIYKEYWNPLANHFLPVMKLRNKTRIGAKIKKTYDTPKTPYDRLIESENLTDTQLTRLKEQHESLNPFELKEAFDKKMTSFFKAYRRHFESLLTKGEKNEAV